MADAQERSIQPLNIRPEPLSIEPGKPLSVRSLVTHPSPLNDALSWTFESRRHRGVVYSLAISPDRRQMATGGLDGVIRIWDMASGELVRMMVGHDQVVHGLSWSPDGSVLASAGGWDVTVRLWDTRRGMPLRVFRGMKSYVQHVAWSHDGTQLVAAGGHSGWLWLWKGGTDKGDILAEVGQDVRSIDWSPSGQHLAVTIIEGVVSVLEISTGKASQTLGLEDPVNYVVRWSPDGSKLLVGNTTQAVIYAIPEGTPGTKIAGLCYSAAWSPDGKLLCTANASGGVQISEADSGKLVKAFVTGATEHVWPSADLLVAKSTIAVSTWQPTTGKQLQNYPITQRTPPFWAAGRPIVTGLGTTKLSLWDNTTAKPLKTLEGHTGPISSLSWTRDGKVLASASHDKTINLWQAASGKLLHTLKEHTGPVLCVAWSPDGKTLASGGGSPNLAAGGDNNVRLWQLSGAPAGILAGHTKPVSALAWSPRGNLLASGSADNTVRFWHPDKGDFLRELAGPRPILALAFSPDGSLLAGGTTDEAVRLWQTSNGAQINQRIMSPGSPPTTTSVAWSPDGLLLFVGRGNHTAQLWNLQEPKIIHSLQAMAPVDYVNVTSAGLLLAGCQDAAVRFWDADSAELRGVILDQEDGLLILSADGNYRFDAARQPNFVAVVQTATDQLMLSPAEFGKKYRWKNAANSVKFTGK
jgi:WD40 repeat protein